MPKSLVILLCFVATLVISALISAILIDNPARRAKENKPASFTLLIEYRASDLISVTATATVVGYTSMEDCQKTAVWEQRRHGGQAVATCLQTR